MKNSKKILALILCVITVVAVSVAGTLAWLTDRESVTNTFTVGKVDIVVDEADVNTDGTIIDGADRVTSNEYHLLPGQTYVKDPTMTVKKDSEESYVRMLLTLNCKKELDEVFAPGVELISIFEGYNPANWDFVTETVNTVDNTVTYEFRCPTTVKPEGDDVVLDALFDSFTVPEELDGDDLAKINDLTITVVGHAIQAKGFDSADAAWTAFDQQMAS